MSAAGGLPSLAAALAGAAQTLAVVVVLAALAALVLPALWHGLASRHRADVSREVRRRW